MTNQEAFDKVCEHLAQQGEPALRDADPARCVYRNAKGQKCAVGCLIPDGQYDPEMEGLGYGSFAWSAKNFAPIPELDKVDWGLLRALQYTHDVSTDLEDLKGRLRRVALDFPFGLDPTAIERITRWEVSEASE